MYKPYRELLKITSEYSGHRCDSASNKRFLKRTLERMFFRGKTDNLVQVCMTVHKGCVTLPEEIMTVIKARTECQIEMVWSHWYEFNSNGMGFDEKQKSGFQQLPGYYYTQYDSPTDRFFPVVRARGKEKADAHIIIHGIHADTGEKVFIKHKGELNSGEYLPLTTGKLIRGTVPLRKILGIEKTETEDYIDLFADTGEVELWQLSSYNPREKNPAYKRIKVMGCSDELNYKATILGRLKILDNYHDNELIPTQGDDIFETIAQEIKLQKTNNIEESIAIGNVSKDLIKKESDYQWSGGDLMNMISISTGGDDDVF